MNGNGSYTPWSEESDPNLINPIPPYGNASQPLNTQPLFSYSSPYNHPQVPFDIRNFHGFQLPHLDYDFSLPEEVAYSTPDDSLAPAYSSAGPVVYEGFVPAPGHEEDDEIGEDNFIPTRQDALFRSSSSDEESDNSEYEREQLAKEEARLQALEMKTLEKDQEYEDEEELEDEPDELLVDEELDEEEESPRPRRSRGAGARGRGRGRGGRRGRPSSRGKGGFRGSKAGGERKPGRPRGQARAVAEPNPEFKEFQRIANDAYLRKDYRTALEACNNAIRVNPDYFVAHSLRSEIFREIGNEQSSTEALIVGASLKRDKNLWFYIIERIKKLDSRKYTSYDNSKKTALILDCLNAILAIDPDDYEARDQKLDIESRLGRISKSIQICKRMLTAQPEDVKVLKQMARIGTSTEKHTRLHLSTIIESFDTSIACFLEHDKPQDSGLDWSLLNIYLELLHKSGEYSRGLTQAKTLARWIQSRKDETFWDELDDDREFDVEDEPRRTEVKEFSRTSPETEYGETLPLEIRTKLGLFRLHLQPPQLEEAMRHFELLSPEDDGPEPTVTIYPDLFADVADALHKAGYPQQALRFYGPLHQKASDELSLQNLMGMYSCYIATDQPRDADEILTELRDWDSDTFEDMALLAKFFEEKGFKEDAMKRAETVYRFGKWRLLQKVGFEGYSDIMEHFYIQKRRERGNHKVKKSRVGRYMAALRKATRTEDTGKERARPRAGLFRTRKSIPDYKPMPFLPDEIPGTNVPMDAIDRALFKQRLNALATDNAEELKAARSQHREIVASFKRLEELMEPATDGDHEATAEWISIARELIEEFSTFNLFYYNRARQFTGYLRRIGAQNDFWKESALMVLAVVANNVEDGEDEPDIQENPEQPPQEFYGIHFDKWFDLFAQYAIFHARLNDQDRCFNTIQVATQANVFWWSHKYMKQLALCRLACGLALDNSSQCSQAVRWFMRNHLFASELFRLYGAANRLCAIATGFATGPSLKAFMRYIKTMDYALLRRDEREKYNLRDADHLDWIVGGASSQAANFVKNHDPAIFTLYAHVLAAGGSYTAALNYYFRAFALTPKDPILNLCIGIAYIQHGMKRLSENRQYQIQQGLSFIYRYYELRTESDVPLFRLEAEFNLGRIWHALGLVTQAIPAYERCIRLSESLRGSAKEDGGGRVDDFAAEAALSLQTIYALSGNFEEAIRVTENVLVLE
ncbi:TPR-like protein [Westerdykella ornata]|uniref:TPR-like protein n=1 Tax=Westerdykella ornata TaxID=318751 RepID=A0A6A6JPR5_WESOR|nr:TPR-like protein [Westerdykella ornata]KAF2278367.1 TPR-like protein [Westerdykella ornata]